MQSASQRIDLCSLRLPEGGSVRALVCGKNVQFEILSASGHPVMAFLYNGLRPDGVAWQRKRFALLLSDEAPAEKAENGVPVIQVPSLPKRNARKISSLFGEDGIWVSDRLEMEIFPQDGGCDISLSTPEDGEIGFFPLTGIESDSEASVNQALYIRNALKITSPIRVESVYEGRTIVRYTPVPHFYGRNK